MIAEHKYNYSNISITDYNIIQLSLSVVVRGQIGDF